MEKSKKIWKVKSTSSQSLQDELNNLQNKNFKIFKIDCFSSSSGTVSYTIIAVKKIKINENQIKVPFKMPQE